MAESKVSISDIEWDINVLEWEINIPDDYSDVQSAPPKPLHHRLFEKILRVLRGLKSAFLSLCKALWRLGADDPRRVYHGIKVGIGLVLVSIFYFNHKMYTEFQDLAVWAVMTVVVIFEFTAGATLSKGLNRMCATLLGGMLALGVNRVARFAVKPVQPYILGAGVFVFGALATCIRLRPVSARYDYGFMIFVMTFSVITTAGYRYDDLFSYASVRLGTVLVGCAICIVISLLVCPVWAGEDLHKLIIRNLQGLAGSLEGCVTDYFKESSDKDSDDDKVSIGYALVLNSKAREETLANFARWEFVPHGNFGIRYPWMQYVKVGAKFRYCAYCVEALNGCINSEIQEPYFLRKHLKEPCMNIVTEASKVLLALADSIKTMTRITGLNLMVDCLKRAMEELQDSLNSQPELFIDSKRWQTVEEAPLPKNMNFKVTPPSERDISQVSRVKKAAGEANIKPVISSKTKIWPHTDIPVTSDNSAVAGRQEVQNNETIPDVTFIDTLSLATVVCLLTKIAARLEAVIIAVDELGERANFTTVEDESIFVNNNATANSPPTKRSPSPLQPMPKPGVVIPAEPPERPMKSILSPLKPIQNPAIVIAAEEQSPEPQMKSVRWAN